MSDSFEESPQRAQEDAEQQPAVSDAPQDQPQDEAPAQEVEQAPTTDAADSAAAEEAPPVVATPPPEEAAPVPAPAPVVSDPTPEVRSPTPPNDDVSPARQYDSNVSDGDISPTHGNEQQQSSQPPPAPAARTQEESRPAVGSATNAARSSSRQQQPAPRSHNQSARDDDRSPHRASSRMTSDSQAGQRLSGNGRQPLIASVSYPARQEGLTVADFLDPSKPLVKSTMPLTKPRGPSFADEDQSDVRKQVHAEKRMQTVIMSSQILAQRNNERKYLKAQYEFEREKKIAERAIYHKERCMQWTQRLSANPLAVDLVADNERIEEEAYIREREERHRKAAADRRKQRIKRAIIVKALAEVPLLEKARKEKRELVEGEKREKALRDVQRVEAIQQRKLLDQELMLQERQAKLDQRMMSGNNAQSR